MSFDGPLFKASTLDGGMCMFLVQKVHVHRERNLAEQLTNPVLQRDAYLFRTHAAPYAHIQVKWDTTSVGVEYSGHFVPELRFMAIYQEPPADMPTVLGGDNREVQFSFRGDVVTYAFVDHGALPAQMSNTCFRMANVAMIKSLGEGLQTGVPYANVPDTLVSAESPMHEQEHLDDTEVEHGHDSSETVQETEVEAEQAHGGSQTMQYTQVEDGESHDGSETIQGTEVQAHVGSQAVQSYDSSETVQNTARSAKRDYSHVSQSQSSTQLEGGADTQIEEWPAPGDTQILSQQ